MPPDRRRSNPKPSRAKPAIAVACAGSGTKAKVMVCRLTTVGSVATTLPERRPRSATIKFLLMSQGELIP